MNTIENILRTRVGLELFSFDQLKCGRYSLARIQYPSRPFLAPETAHTQTNSTLTAHEPVDRMTQMGTIPALC